MSHLSFSILAFSTNFCPIKSDLSGNTVWPQASGFQKLTKMDQLTFVHSKCKCSLLRSQCWMRLFLWFSNTVHLCIFFLLLFLLLICNLLTAFKASFILDQLSLNNLKKSRKSVGSNNAKKCWFWAQKSWSSIWNSLTFS